MTECCNRTSIFISFPLKKKKKIFLNSWRALIMKVWLPTAGRQVCQAVHCEGKETVQVESSSPQGSCRPFKGLLHFA